MWSPSLRRRIRGATIFAALAVIAVAALYPLWYMAINALKTREEFSSDAYGMPTRPSLDNFAQLAESANLFGAVANSLLVVILAVVVTTFVAALASFPLARLRFVGSRVLFGSIVGLLLIPGQVLLIPIYLLFSRIGMVGDYRSLIGIYVAMSLPFSVFLLTSNFRGIPSELIEAARIDGASMFKIFRSIILPLGRPAIVTLIVLNFLALWNELLLALLLLPDESQRLLTPALAGLVGKFATNQPLLMSGLLLSSAPAIVLLIICSRYVVRGVSVGVGR